MTVPFSLQVSLHLRKLSSSHVKIVIKFNLFNSILKLNVYNVEWLSQHFVVIKLNVKDICRLCIIVGLLLRNVVNVVKLYGLIDYFIAMLIVYIYKNVEIIRIYASITQKCYKNVNISVICLSNISISLSSTKRTLSHILYLTRILNHLIL